MHPCISRHSYIHVHMHAYIHVVCTCTCTHVCMLVYMCIHVHMYALYMCMHATPVCIVTLIRLRPHPPYPPYSWKVCRHSLVVLSHSRTVLSSLAERISRPSGENRALRTQLLWAHRENWNFWRWTVHTCAR